jgi:hypothetical protein
MNSAAEAVAAASDGPIAPDTDAIITAFKRDGVVKIDDLIDPALLTRCREQTERDFPDLEAHQGSGSYGLESRRFSIPLPITGAFAEERIFANPTVAELLNELLGPVYEMDSCGLLVSLPGAPAQRPHHDALLFPESTLDTLLPPTTVAVSIPLVAMDEVNGTTAFWRGSHRNRNRADEPDFVPRVALGSALLWDYRLIHSGCANNSDAPRPVLFLVFCRRWWHEHIPVEAEKYERVVIERAAFERLDKKQRRHMARAKVIDR